MRALARLSLLNKVGAEVALQSPNCKQPSFRGSTSNQMVQRRLQATESFGETGDAAVPSSETKAKRPRLVRMAPLEIKGQLLKSQPDEQRGAAALTPKQMRDKYLTFFMPDFDGLVAELLGRMEIDNTFVNQVLDSLTDDDRIDITFGMALKVTDGQMAKFAADPGARQILWRMVNAIRDSLEVSEDDRVLQRVLFVVSPEHKRLKDEPWAKMPEIKASLDASGAKLQSIGSGWASGFPQFDEYAVTVDAMPPGLAPEAFLSEMTNDINTAVNDYWFDVINEFKRTKTDKPPALGDIYHIDIKGPDNGSVMLVESKPDHFIFQTVATAQDGTHPEYGSREFGFDKNADGSVRFYTRGASRSGMLPGTSLLGKPIQTQGWTRLVTGIATTLQSRGGKVRSGSIQSWRSHE